MKNRKYFRFRFGYVILVCSLYFLFLDIVFLCIVVGCFFRFVCFSVFVVL